jgi:hypothetical protein
VHSLAKKNVLLTKMIKKILSEYGIYCTYSFENFFKLTMLISAISISELFYEEIDNLHQR